MIFVKSHCQIPEGGISMISESYNFAGSGTSSEIPVEGLSFTMAVRTAIGSGVMNIWDSRLSIRLMKSFLRDYTDDPTDSAMILKIILRMVK